MTTLAISGTPGTGKSTVSRLVRTRGEVREVYELAPEPRTRRPPPGNGTRVVDLELAGRWLRSAGGRKVEVVVGHLAHLLPIRDVVVLRCHPRELAGRLSRSRPGRAAELRENLLAETMDVILLEALVRRRRIWEIDTTGRAPESVAREVERRLRHRGPPAYGRVDWLADPWVTEHLLDWSR